LAGGNRAEREAVDDAAGEEQRDGAGVERQHRERHVVQHAGDGADRERDVQVARDRALGEHRPLDGDDADDREERHDH
jgi:hypothetical protein